MLPAIDWSAAWLKGLSELGQRLPPHGSVAQRLNAIAGPGAPRFVAQEELPRGKAYESHVFETGCVPTRDNLHDLFNGLIWLRHGSLKRRLNEWHSKAIRDLGVGPTRGALRDALTLFDENGAIWLDADPVLHEALLRRDWKGLFLMHRERWMGQSFHVFGHALLEQLCTRPRKSLCAHVLVGDPLALGEAGWAAKPFLPLPVLGIPGWWPGQALPGFYEDPRIFRNPRALEGSAEALTSAPSPQNEPPRTRPEP